MTQWQGQAVPSKVDLTCAFLNNSMSDTYLWNSN